ncbi:MAG: hypothetical protein ACJA0Q_000145 [Saprospiraceae bacterium]|jgi:hypothetical protein
MKYITILCAILFNFSMLANTTVTPSTANAGETLTVTITSSTAKFIQGSSTVYFSFASIWDIANSINYTDDTTAVVNITVPITTFNGTYNAGAIIYYSSGNASVPFIITGNPQPAILGVSPSNATVNETLQVTITGDNTHFTQGSASSVKFSFDQASTTSINSYNAVNDSLLYVNITVPPNVKTGSYSVNITNPRDGSVTYYSALYITGFNPKITAVSPDTLTAGTTLSVSITGSETHFNQGSTSSLSLYLGQSGNAITSYTTINDSLITANVQIPTNTKTGKYNLTISNNIDGYLTYSNQVYVIGANPQIVSITPDTLKAGTTLNVTISGSETRFTQGSSSTVSLYFSQASATVNSTSIVNDSTISVNITVDPSSISETGALVISNSIDGSLYSNIYIQQIGAVVGTSTTPSSSLAGNTITVVISDPDATFTQINPCCVLFGGGIITNNFTILNDSTISVNITIPIEVGDGNYDVIVYGEDFQKSFRVASAFKVGTTTEVSTINSTTTLVYPNPADSWITVESKNSTVMIFDLKGQLKLSNNSKSDIKNIDVSSFTSGVYFIKVISENSSKDIKLIKL